jgi:translation initiation factor IF-2
MQAGLAVNFAYLFNAAFSGGLQGPIPFKVELTQPAGPSTAGGKQARQHIRLVPFAGGAAIVMGSYDPITRSAELRTFNHVADLHARRFRGAAVPIDPAHYQQLVGRMKSFFGTQGIDVSLVDVSASSPPEAMAPAAQPAPSSSMNPIIVLLSIILLLIIVILVLVILRTRH